MPVLGGYHNFMISIGVQFSQINLQKGLVLPKKNSKISMLNKSINIFLKTINEFPQCWFLEILKATNYPLPILTNRVLLIFY
jgi:hypothetical protein